MKALINLTAALLLASSASAQLTTLRVEIDYMEDANHSHKPTQLEIDAVVQMFACKGINLIVVIDDAIPHTNITSCFDPGASNFFTCAGSPAAFAVIAANHRDSGAGWHYCVFGHRYDDGDGIDSSGIAEINGNDFFVADGVFLNPDSKPFKRAATFAHELGHNLGLRHYAPGTTPADKDPYSPNLASIMSYRYQLNGVASQLECQGLVGNDHLFKNLDYSSGRLRGLNELSLRESVGMGMRRVDWNCDGAFGPLSVSRELNYEKDWCAQGSGNGTLFDYDEWSALVDSSDSPAVLGNHVALEVATCASPLDETDGPSDCPSGVTLLTSEPCQTGLMLFVHDSGFPLFQSGTGQNPYVLLDTAVNNSPDGSVLYLQAGTISTAGGAPIVITKRLVLAGPGGAVVNP